ncbi:MAG: hypothetical protein U5K72_19450 [Balneolaceae bacterium]|nr:hypothetical protein [Balneolaceae bacterium]
MNHRLFSSFTKKLLKGLLLPLTLFIIGSSFSTAFAQIDALTNSLDIVEVVYEKDGVFYTQTTAGTVPSDLDDPVVMMQ